MKGRQQAENVFVNYHTFFFICTTWVKFVEILKKGLFSLLVKVNF